MYWIWDSESSRESSSGGKGGGMGMWGSDNELARCLTKVHCGEQCKDQDWVGHKEVCREGE